MRHSSFVVAFALGLAGAVYAGDQVTTQAAEDADFSECKTYQWAKTGQEISNPITAGNVNTAIDTQLAAKGWSKSASGTCYVAYQVAEQQQRGANWSGMGGFGRFGGGMGNIQSYTMETGELVVSIHDSKKKAIWIGTAKGTVDPNPQKAQKSIDNDIKKMFAKFPPGSEKK
jgi:uncharacterized membrane protein